ncbi:hypothetical protein NG821_08325 [Prevotella cerevisiae]|uniref:Uncharacterized protein n=1 Tax=Segatella cerevisiae TaxID=2053716 RepID=A0ABT1BXR6_9BACT|nr:hypothetical protein [Segatella cerevisiae]MCO6025841.1 hypothetical protein [Segatella cerevisiae]
MKKSVLIALFSLLSIFAQAQNEHLKFNGIPLTGTIEQYQKQLISKGFKLNKFSSKYSVEDGTRIFNGKFLNKKAKIAVYFDPETQIVFAAQAYYNHLNAQDAKIRLEELRKLLASKYGNNAFVEHDQSPEQPGFIINAKEGQIYGFVQKSKGVYHNFSTHIQYTDAINSSNHKKQFMNDL